MSDRIVYDMAIIGGGPAGSSAALAGAGRGLKVVVLEGSALPRPKTCGGGVVARALRYLPDGVALEVERSCQAAELWLAADGPGFRVERSAPLIHMTTRADFDLALLRAAKAAGAEIVAPARVAGIAPGEDHVDLRTDAGSFRARFVVAADGATGSTARQLGWPPLPQTIPALDWELPLDAGTPSRLLDAARFDFHSVRAGYAWVFPKRDHLSAGILTTSRRSYDLKHALGAYLESFGVRPEDTIRRRGYVIPVRPRRGGAMRGRVLLAGDAAGFADPLTCEGISPAILSGRLAAEAVATGAPNPTQVRRRYQAALGVELLPELRWGRRLALLLYRLPRFRDRVFRRDGQLFCELMADVISGVATYGQLLGRPGNYARLLGLAPRR